MAFEKKEQTYNNPGGLIADIFKKKGEEDARKEALKNQALKYSSSPSISGVDSPNLNSFSGMA